jgi:hypothetical protein
MQRLFEIRGHEFFLIFAALVLTSTLPLIDWADISWHDQQRIGQILVIALTWAAALFCLRMRWADMPTMLTIGSYRIVAIVLIGGMISAVLARHPLWAFAELALVAGSLWLGWIAAVTRRLHGPIIDHLFLSALFFICSALVLRFAVAYLAAVLGDSGILDIWLLLDGFSNIRFYGQFLTLALPLLVAPLLVVGPLHRHAWIAAAVSICTWLLAIASGTRGTWLGMAVAGAVLVWLGRAGRRWMAWQIAAVAMALMLFWITMTAIPEAMGMQLQHHASSRLTTSISGRGPIWQMAVDAAMQHPLLGIGPMHFASLPNPIATHPHQAWLLWAAEWGFPSTLLVTWLVICGAAALKPVLLAHATSRDEPDILRLCISGSLIAGLTQSMVDGVLVMPYSQLWLSLLAGWLLGLHPSNVRIGNEGIAGPGKELKGPLCVWLAATGLAAGLLLFIAGRDYPHLAQREQIFSETIGGHLQPRFWLQGVIAP